YYNGLAWGVLTVPFWITATSGGNIAYCLESNKHQPWGDDYHVSSALYSEHVLAGVRAILLHGYPNEWGDLELVEVWAATQAAIWTWMYEAGGVGYESMAEHNIRPTAGNQAAYKFYQALLGYARRGDDHISGSFSVPRAELTPDGSGKLSGTTTITINTYQSYRIDQSKLPAGVTAAGSTYLTGDTITITAPMSYMGKDVTIQDAIVLLDTRSPVNIFWYAPDSGDLQKMALVDMSLQPMLSGNLSFTSEDQTCIIYLHKRNRDKSKGDYSLAGAVYRIYERGTGKFVADITTDADGNAQSAPLPLADYDVREVTAPYGFLLDDTVYNAYFINAGAPQIYISAGDTPQQGKITVKKTNANSALGDYSLSGAVFEIFNGSTLVDTITTDASGSAQSKALNLGNYTVKEKTAPNGFVLNNASFPANLEYAGQNVQLAAIYVTVPEQPQRGIVHINKTNANAAQGDYSLQGAVFEIRDSQGKLVDTVTTDANGKASSKELPLGSYVVTEKTAPYGFLRDTNEYDAVLTYAGQDVAVTTCTVNVPEKPQTGKITVKKTNANPALGDYSLQGAVFEIYSGSTLVDTVTTNAAGEAQSKALKLGSYTVKEKTAPYGYVLNTDSFTAKLEYAGQDVEIAVVSVTVPEQPQRGVIRIAKANASPAQGDYSLQGAVFEIRDAQGKLADTVTTDSNGQANSKELPLGSYTVSEKTAPQGFVRNRNTFGVQLTYAGQTVTVVYADVAVAEQPQVGKITVTKKDASTGDTAQGDATLAGAVFEVYKSDKSTLVDTIYCAGDVKATTKELPLGTYYVREKSAPVGYTLDEEFHQVKLVYAGQDVDVTSTSYDLKNKVIQGQIAITKHIDAPMEGYDDPQIEQPLEGAVFQVYLSAAGSYDAAKESERDLITTNENGFAVSKKLPYGVYTVAEIEAPGDVKMVNPFQVFISQEGKIYRFILNNITFRSQVKVIKVDAETGKPILLAGTTFKVKDLATGKWVTQHVDYPTPADISEFETAPDGTLVLPEPLKSGEYELVEVLAPRGYLLSDKPVKFTVHSSNEQDMVTVTMENKPGMGKVKVEKTGDMLTGVKEIETIFGKQYLPIFEMGYLSGAEFDVVAAEDIITADGTVRAKKGNVVDHIVTGEDGQALSKKLYLGEYVLVETKAPANYVLDSMPHPVSLVYENQTVAVVTSQIGITNARQLVEIELLKKMEGFDKFDKFEDVIFGLYTAQDIYAEDGKLIIAKDSLILTQDSLMALSALDDDGCGRFEGELPFAKYYVLELQTAEGFILDSTKYPVDASYTGEDNAVTRIKINGGEAILNKRALGELRILKLDAHTHEPLQCAKFGLFQGEKKLGEAVTDTKGYALFNDLAFGEYQVKELEAPEGYVLVDEIYTINIRENGQKVLLEVLNQEQPGEPEEPDEPDEPDEPEIPDEPDEPDVPDEPEEPTEPEQPTEPDKPVPPPAGYPKTGDDSKLALWIGLLCIAAGGAAAALWMRGKKKKETEEQPDEKE
ncbi:MAG: SpaA isopeptide-forming pilin-related protein, partial [Firmicutes bacterium]|nr:SpaA isopeptide-forming pilin-related protein [Bacillota bacterium]